MDESRKGKKIIVAAVLAWLVTGTGSCALVTNFHYRAIKSYEKDPALARYSGGVNVPGLEGEVHVYRDEYGIPHIFSDNAHDLFFATGYVQAQDRLWEMVLLRAVAEGRTAELLGDIGVPGVKMMGMPLSTVGMDRHQRIMGMKHMGEIAAAMLRETNPKVHNQLQAFCDGVNAYIDSLREWEDLPVEFQVLKVRPGHWRVEDMMAFGRFIGSMLCSNMEIELSRYAAIKKYGPDRGWELYPLYGAPGGPTIVPTKILKNRLESPRDLPPGGRPSQDELGYDLPLSGRDAAELATAEAAFRAALGIDLSLGSNNWVVSGDLTESGRPMLANDPHLQHIQPSLFYLMHIKGAGYDAFGVTFPGNPYVVLGHTREFAWGATTSRADVQDLFIETTDPDRPGMYKYKGEWRPFYTRKEIIKVRIGSRMREREFEIRHTVHGPVINEFADMGEDGPAVALRWTGWDISRDLRSFQLAVSSESASEYVRAFRGLSDKFDVLSITAALERLNRASSLDDFIEAMDMLALPNQNWVGVDKAGRIAYLPGGLAPIRNKGIGVLPVPGQSGEFDWSGFIPLMELPHAIDPKRGWMVTANNQVVDPRFYPYVFSTHYAPPWRAWRIEEMIEELRPLSVEDMARIQNDVYVRRAEWQVPMILRAVENKDPEDKRVIEAAAELEGWDYVADLDNTAALIFFEFKDALFDNVLGDELDKADLKAARIEGYPDMRIDLWLAQGESEFFDDRSTRGVVEDMDDMIVQSLADAMARVHGKWGKKPSDRRWGDVHVIKWFHPLGIGRGKVLSVGPYPHLGADHTVRNAKKAGFGRVPYKSMTGPCMRHVIDMAEPDSALVVIDGSQSGQWLSPHYRDMHPLFVNSGYIRADKDPERIKAKARYHLVLKP